MLKNNEKTNDKIVIEKIQNFPYIDSYNPEPFKGLVEVFSKERINHYYLIIF